MIRSGILSLVRNAIRLVSDVYEGGKGAERDLAFVELELAETHRILNAYQRAVEQRDARIAKLEAVAFIAREYAAGDGGRVLQFYDEVRSEFRAALKALDDEGGS